MSNALLADVVDIRRWLAEDAGEPFEVRVARDREICRDIGSTGRGTDNVARVRAWWRAIGAGPERLIGARTVTLVRLATTLLFGGGVLAGVGVGSAAFAYTGAHPVNLLLLLGLLVCVPLLLLILTLLLLLPGRIPGFDAVREAVSVINPGRWAGAWLDRFAGVQLYGGFARGRTGFARWQLVVFSQWLAVGFFVGLLLLAWIRVAVTDLAFGWSTTLELDAADVHAVLSAFSAPWQGWLSSASPDLALVEASRFNRLETAPISKERALLLGGWWPFVLMTILVYGLLPRLVLLGIGVWRLASATRVMFLRDPEVVALLDRMEQPHVTFEQDEDLAGADESGSPTETPGVPLDGSAAIVIWNDAVSEEAARRWARRRLGAEGAVLRFAVWLKPEQLRAALAGLDAEFRRVIVITKGWEPPVLEFADFLAELRERVGEGATIVVVPMDVAGRSVQPTDRAVWARALARQGHPRLYVMPAQEETA